MRIYRYIGVILLMSFLIFLMIGCSGNSIKPALLNENIVISVESKPLGAVVSFRVESSGGTSEIPATNFVDIGRTPYFSTQSLQKLIPLLTESLLKDVTLVMQIKLEGHYTITERLAPEGILAFRTIKKVYNLTRIKE